MLIEIPTKRKILDLFGFFSEKPLFEFHPLKKQLYVQASFTFWG